VREDAPGSQVPFGVRAPGFILPLAVLGDAAGAYDDPKAWALALLGIGLGLAWLLDRRPSRPPGPGSTLDGPTRWLRVAVAAYAAWWLLTTPLALLPAQSLWGSLGRGHGLVAVLAAVLLFARTHATAAGRPPARTVVDPWLLGSVVVSALAVGQALGWDPLPPAWDPATVALRVRSTFGQHIFLGTYLAVLAPVTLARLVSVGPDTSPVGVRAPDGGRSRALPGAHSRPAGRGIPPWPWRRLGVGAAWIAGAVALPALAARWRPGWWLLLGWGLAGALAWAWADRHDAGRLPPGAERAGLASTLALQLGVLFLCQARGAFLGALAGLGVLVAGLVLRRGGRRRQVAVGAGLAIGLLAFAFLNVPTSPLARWARETPGLRLVRIVEVAPGSPGWVRLQVWRGILAGWRRQLAGVPVVQETDPHVRSVVGFGLESQRAVLGALVPQALQPQATGTRIKGSPGYYSFDRAHNDALDHLVTGGLVGLALWALVGGALGVVGVRRVRLDEPESLLRLGALGALTADLVAGLFGIATPTSRALAAVLAGLATRPARESPSPAPARGPVGRPQSWAWAVLAGAGLVGLVVAGGATRGLLASLAYGRAARTLLAGGDAATARGEFARAARLAPWLPETSEAVVSASLEAARAAPAASSRAAALAEARAALLDARPYVARLAAHWRLTGRVEWAIARGGEPADFGPALAALARAAALAPEDAALRAEWGLVALEAKDAALARRLAEAAVGRDPEAWLGWLVLARAAEVLGDAPRAAEARARVQAIAPPGVRRLLDDPGN
jgi:hypothetical protein